MMDLSKLRPFIADSEDGPDTALVIKGFSSREEIEAFMNVLLESGVTKGAQDRMQ